jgi:5-methylcytosine-specific restriction endonuclease McrA
MPHADPVARQAYNREWKRKNRWRYREHTKARDAARHANERAEKYGRPGTLTVEDVKKILDVDECFWCGARGELTVDHVIGLHDARSTNTIENCVAACGPCNKRKQQKERPDAWSKHGDRCTSCNRSDVPHAARGLCRVCDRAAKRLDITEAEFQRQVVELARLLGWWTYHTHDSRQSNAGFPDLVLIRSDRIVFAELKSRRGKVRPEQQLVLDLLARVPGVESYLWRPADWDCLLEILGGRFHEEAAA